MDVLLEELASFMPESRQMVRVIVRLLVATLVGAIVGFQRERIGKPAGLRTHMLVSLGAALFVLAPSEMGMTSADLSRIIQGLATGIGFIGGGAILKLHDQRDIEGLTTASGIWMTAALGVAVGLGALGVALLSVALTWVILTIHQSFEARLLRKQTTLIETEDSKK